MKIQHRTSNIEHRTPKASGGIGSFGVQRSAFSVRRSPRERGSVLVLVLWIAVGLVTLTVYFANSSSFELQAADNRASGVMSEQAIDGAARYVTFVLANYATNGTLPSQFYYQSAAVPVGDSHFWLIGRDTNSPALHPDQVFFGLTDENGKLNLNTATLPMLQSLPNIDQQFAANIITWRTNDTSSGGVSASEYAMLSPSYQPKEEPFETTEELRLVYGSDIQTLVGEDANRNGVLDPSEKDENRNSTADPGILEYVTVYSKEPNTNPDGTALINVRTISGQSQTDLQSLLQTNLTSDRAQAIIQRLTGGNSGGNGGPGGNNGNGGNSTTYRSPLAFYVASQMTADEFALIADKITTVTNSFIDGRININTASPYVLYCIPGISNYVDQVVSYRQANPDKLTSIAWVLDAVGLTGTDATQFVTQVGNRITTKSYQFMADVAALGPHGRGYRRVRFIFDTSAGTPRIIYRRDMTHLGWALGKNVRQVYLANNTEQ
jgi:type II secretory pathway component PulK